MSFFVNSLFDLVDSTVKPVIYNYINTKMLFRNFTDAELMLLIKTLKKTSAGAEDVPCFLSNMLKSTCGICLQTYYKKIHEKIRCDTKNIL